MGKDAKKKKKIKDIKLFDNGIILFMDVSDIYPYVWHVVNNISTLVINHGVQLRNC